VLLEESHSIRLWTRAKEVLGLETNRYRLLHTLRRDGSESTWMVDCGGGRLKDTFRGSFVGIGSAVETRRIKEMTLK
jgi:hypothetical protein